MAATLVPSTRSRGVPTGTVRTEDLGSSVSCSASPGAATSVDGPSIRVASSSGASTQRSTRASIRCHRTCGLSTTSVVTASIRSSSGFGGASTGAIGAGAPDSVREPTFRGGLERNDNASERPNESDATSAAGSEATRGSPTDPIDRTGGRCASAARSTLDSGSATPSVLGSSAAAACLSVSLGTASESAPEACSSTGDATSIRGDPTPVSAFFRVSKKLPKAAPERRRRTRSGSARPAIANFSVTARPSLARLRSAVPATGGSAAASYSPARGSPIRTSGSATRERALPRKARQCSFPTRQKKTLEVERVRDRVSAGRTGHLDGQIWPGTCLLKEAREPVPRPCRKISSLVLGQAGPPAALQDDSAEENRVGSGRVRLGPPTDHALISTVWQAQDTAV